MGPHGGTLAESTSANTGAAKTAFDLAERKREHWAWQPIRPARPPEVRNTNWPRDPLDRFLLAKLEARELAPAPTTDKRTLLRRLSFDLIGLPPTPEEIEVFLRDDSACAVEKVVDRLLGSPHFGERWGRHWLDLVRYAETRGHEFDYPIPSAYHYRDYVIRALNADVPYNQFVLEHLAGDLLPTPRLHPMEGFNESILGTAFWFLGEEVHSPVDVRQDQADRFDNKVDVLSKAFLGLTVACARCHDHKFDAISTKDYYALFGFLQSSHYRLARFDSMEHNRRVAAELWELREKSRAEIQKAIADALRPGARRTAEYLLAAGEILAQAEATPRRLEKIVRERKLDANILRQWVSHLQTAAREENDPLRFFTNPSGGRNPPEGRLRGLTPPARGDSPTVLIDYAHCKPENWLTDGPTFGPGPVRPGELIIRGDASKPVVRFREYAAAEKEPTWDMLRSASGEANDPGALGGVMRAGRTLRTPTFPLTTGKVFYLVKGSGLVYAAIGSHVMIAGPLHAQLVRTVNAGARFQWVAHDLSAYQGQRIHLEFTPTGTDDFAVARVVQGEKPPTLPDHSNAFLCQALAGADSVESLAQAYQRLFLDTLDKLATNRLLGSSEATDRADLANWMLTHSSLFGTANPGGERLRDFLAQQAKIADRIRRESRLCVAMIDGSPEDDYVFIRGSHKARGETVPRRFLEALGGSPSSPPPTPPKLGGIGGVSAGSNWPGR